jgi:hypothetical protein
MKFTIAYRWNDHEYHENFDNWFSAMRRYWELVAAGKGPTLHERSTK